MQMRALPLMTHEYVIMVEYSYVRIFKKNDKLGNSAGRHNMLSMKERKKHGRNIVLNVKAVY